MIFHSLISAPHVNTPFPYTTLFRSDRRHRRAAGDQPGDVLQLLSEQGRHSPPGGRGHRGAISGHARAGGGKRHPHVGEDPALRSEEHTSELQSLRHLVWRLLLEKIT